ncbi:MAG: cyanoglobin [Marinilabiliales bacterium]|nr:MAG: cyanoglobin [Marinilabiliales bacterium]
MQIVVSPYERIGEKNIKELIHHFYQELRNDDILRPMYKEELIAAEERLYLFMVQYLGGPQHYNEKRGHPKLRQRHMQFPIDEKAKNSWLNNMRIALDKTEISSTDKEFLWDYFEKTANFLKNK